MKVYLVDFENVKSKGLAGVDKLTEYDRVIIFYSENADTINFEMHQKVMMSKADVEYLKVNVGGKNALDFQLSTLLGYLVATKGYSHLFVISNDKSFDFLHDFWHGKYITSPDCIVYRTRTIAAAMNYSGTKRVDEGVEDAVDTAEESETIAAQAEAVQPVPERDEPVQTAAQPQESAPEEALPLVVEERAEEHRAKLDDSALFEYYQQFFNNAKAQADVGEEKAQVEVDTAEIENMYINAIIKDLESRDKVDTAESEQPAEEAPKAHEQANAAQDKKSADDKKPAKSQGGTYIKMLSDVLEGSGCTQDEVKLISQLLAASETKEEFHNNLAKEFKQQATELYKSLRPKYLRLKEKYAAENAQGSAKAEAPAAVNDKAQEAPQAEQAKQENAPQVEVAAATEKVEEKRSGRKKKQENAPEVEVAIAPEKSEEKRSGRKKKQENAPESEVAAAPEKSEEKRSGRKKKQENAPEVEVAIAPEKSEETAAASPRDRLAQLLDGICTEEELGVICELFDNASTKQQLYIRMVKAFKKERGCKFYNAIKNEYLAIKN